MITRVLLLLGIGIDGLTLVTGFLERSYFPSIWNDSGEELTDSEGLFVIAYLLVALVGVLVFVATAVFFLAWIKRSYQNLSAFNVQSLRSSPGWAVGYWFIPLLCFYYPLMIVNELYHGSDPDVRRDETRFSDTSTPMLHGFWWGLWVTASIVSNITLRISLRTSDPSMVEFADMIDMILLPFWMVCGWLAYEIVKNITNRQETVGLALTETQPPKPPTFDLNQDGTI